jgi:hypothetical protein
VLIRLIFMFVAVVAMAGAGMAMKSLLGHRTCTKAAETRLALVSKPARVAALSRATRARAELQVRPSLRTAGSAAVLETEGGEAFAGPAFPEAAIAPAPAAARPLTYDEIVWHARQVEYEAGRRTDLLASRIPLSAEQQAAAFRIYARASAAYDPVIPIEGASAAAPETSKGTSAEEQIYEVLDENQRAMLDQDAADRDLWWTEIIGQLAVDLPSVAEPAVASMSAARGAVQPAPHQGGNVLDILNGGN